MHKVVTLFILLFLTSFCKGQQAAYFNLGEDQFRGVQIYDIVQDKDLNYWVATNDGLFLYNYTAWQKIEIENAKSNSLFNFVKDKNGVIYCHNLNHQVFKIKNKRCSLFYELKEDEVRSDLNLCMNGNSLLVGGKKIIRLSAEGIVTHRFRFSASFLGLPFNSDAESTIYHLGFCDSVLVVKGTECKTEQIKVNGAPISKNDILTFFRMDSSCYAINLKNKALYKVNLQTLELMPVPNNLAFGRSASMRIYSTKNNLWVAGTLPGVANIKNNLIPDRLKILYEDFFISDVYEDEEGNILLSTFDKGIIVVPDLNVTDVIYKFKDEIITSMQIEAENALWLGSSNGWLYESVNGSLTCVDKSGTRSIEKLATQTNFPLLIYDNGQIRAFNKKTRQATNIYPASLKDVAIVSANLFFIGTNRGILKCTWEGGTKFTCEVLPGVTFRIYHLAFNPANNCLYASTSNGLLMIEANGNSSTIRVQNEDIFPNSLSFYNGLIYASNKKGGVLLIKNNKVIKTLPLLLNNQSEASDRIFINNHLIFCKSQKGIFQFDTGGKHNHILCSPQTFSGQRLIDFAIDANSLWISHTGGIQQLNLQALQKQTSAVAIRLDNVLVNDSAHELKTQYFSNTQRKFQFVLRSPTLRNRESIRYHYMLEGNDERWSVNNYPANQVTYNALAPGTYVFKAKTEKLGVFSDAISYTFHIASPVYARWWFILLAAMLIAGLMYVVYKRQLNRQRKKSEQMNELNASKLTAIQSQMNPHFIFNSLNSIQDLILKGDVENSYSYITTFSNMVRKTLNYSDKDFIDFEQEVKLIELYLSLEQLRFKKDFTYSLHTNEIADIQIPPMLIQPFIENALVHGLLHKEGTKQLLIKFELGEFLICTIEDNGVGREKAKSIKNRQRSEYDSFSGKATRKRFDILSEIFAGKFGFTYEDIKLSEEVTGTRVVLQIPVKHKY